jgi:hypothetical protein
MTTWSRRRALAFALVALVAVAGAVAAVVAAAGSDGGQRSETALKPVDPFETVLDATERYPLVGLGEFHLMQEWHDFMSALLRRPELAGSVDDIVVEFGNARYQRVADRFVLDLEPVDDAELAQIWRDTIGGRVIWDAPVYEQFFRNVRAVNEGLPQDRRIRVLLGDPAVDFARIRSAADRDELPPLGERDRFFASVVEREVLAKGRRAFLVAGADHLRRGQHANDDPAQPNVGTLLERRHPGKLFVVDPLPFNERDGEAAYARVEEELRSWPRPSLALLEGTWLGAQGMTFRALEPDLTFGEQVDAVLWLGPETSLTASQADPSLYRSGAYAAELRRRSQILSAIEGGLVDLVAEGLALSTADPGLNDGWLAVAEYYDRAAED